MTAKPIAWAAMHNGRVVQTTHDPELAQRWRANGGDVLPLVAQPKCNCCGNPINCKLRNVYEHI